MKSFEKEVLDFKQAMQSAMDNFFGDDEEKRTKFYESEFTITFNDKNTGKQTALNLFNSAWNWQCMEDFIESLEEDF